MSATTSDREYIMQEKSGSDWGVLAILSVLMAFASISTDLYLPAMPTMAKSLHANAGIMELTVSTYLVGFSFGQLVWGPIGDRYGRRMPVAIGIGLFIVGSAGCALSQDASFLLGARLLQAFGACAGVVLARAMIRDLFHGARAAQMLSILMSVMAIAPLLGPLVGGEILHLQGWRAIFWLLVIVGISTLLALIRLPETLSEERKVHLPLSHVMRRYCVLLQHKRFVLFASTSGFFYGGMFAYVAGTPAAFITYYGLPPEQYGLLFAVGILGIMLTNVINSKLVKSRGIHELIFMGTLGAAISGAGLLYTATSGAGGLWGLVIPLLGFIGATGFIVANSISGALADFPDNAGSASALIGTFQYGSGILGAGLVGLFANGTPVPLAIIIAASGFGCVTCAIQLQKLRVEEPTLNTVT